MNPQDLESIRRDIDSLAAQLETLKARVSLALPSPTPTATPAPVSKRPKSIYEEFNVPAPNLTGGGAAPRRTTSTGDLLGIIASICFVLAGVFLVRLAIQAGWLTPERQFGLSILFGIALILAGFTTKRVDSVYSSLLPGSGVIVLAAAAIGGHRYFEIYGPIGAMLAMAAASICSLSLYLHFRHDFFIVTAAVGTYVLPLMLNSQGSPIEHVATYFVLWTATFSFASVLIESRLLPLISGYLAIGVFAFIAEYAFPREYMATAATLLALVVFVIFGVFRYSVRTNQLLNSEQAWAYFPLAIFFYGVEYYYVDKIAPDAAPWFGLTFAAAILGIHRLAHRKLGKPDMPSGQMLISWSAVIAFHSGYLQLLPLALKPWLLVAFLVLAPLVKARPDARTLQSYAIPFLTLLLILAIEYGRILWNLLDTSSNGNIILGLVVTAGLVSFSRVAGQAGYVLLTAAHFQAIAALFRMGDPSGSLAVSGLWAAYSVIVLGLGVALKDPVLGRSSLVVLLIAAAKALLYDASNAAAPVRVLCLALTGALLYGSGLLFKRISTWKIA